MVQNISEVENKQVIGEFWTSKQRQSHKIHYVVSYRASFKPELPAFFIQEYLLGEDRVVFDPFGGRGTTAIEANLQKHRAIHNDINPISIFLARSRQVVPSIDRLQKKLHSLNLKTKLPETEEDRSLYPFYHKDTINEIKNLRILAQHDDSPEMQYVMLTALSRLHGHSPGFFSVYTFPQVSIAPEAQAKNNLKRNQVPDYREVKPRIMRKMKRDLSQELPDFYHQFSKNNRYTNLPSDNLHSIEDSCIDLVITSPPFLDKVDYVKDNWLKAWFLGYEKYSVPGISIYSNLLEWEMFIHRTFKEASRIMKPDALFVMEVGEVKYGKEILNLDEIIIRAAQKTTLEWIKTYIHSQKFTKLSNCWNVSNNELGTNTNRCVVFRNNK
jgi:DNA modification methylase